MTIIPLFTMNGNAEEALRFYEKAFGGTVSELMHYRDQPENGLPAELGGLLLSGILEVPGGRFYFNDNLGEAPVSSGGQVSTFLTCDSEEQLTSVYNALQTGAKEIKFELQRPFWSTLFAALTDQYGNSWTLNYNEGKGHG